ncbi:DUF4352 domain-containing protein [Lentilactobacillus buchneri]|uniref:DUF4352 domain-containing protein n=1 Tax=Lentilactobacillus buchneri TaxID=1581 RepID=UPI0021A5EDE8|nr:DUF4352 domain-containing protein [Lentilactobacillus buchneri]MCT2882046.1 DUF4352 domain-containing protein [Lentilactobacillus buchneri]
MNNNSQKPAKPWYKKWWVWVLVVFGLVIAVNAVSGEEDDSASNQSTTTATQDSSSSNSDGTLKSNYNVGEVANYKGYKFKINKVTFYNGNEFDTPKDGNRYVICNVTIKNDTDEKQPYNSFDFKLNANGNSTNMMEVVTNEKYTNNTLNSGDLDPGASVTGNLIGQAKRDTDLKLEYQPSIWDDKTVKVDINESA